MAWPPTEAEVRLVHAANEQYLHVLRTNLSKIGEAPQPIRAALFIELLSLLSSRSCINTTTGAILSNYETAIHLVFHLMCRQHPLLPEFQQIVRSLGLKEMKKIGFDRFLGDRADPKVQTRIINIVCVAMLILRCSEGEMLSKPESMAKVKLFMGNGVRDPALFRINSARESPSSATPDENVSRQQLRPVRQDAAAPALGTAPTAAAAPRPFVRSVTTGQIAPQERTATEAPAQPAAGGNGRTVRPLPEKPLFNPPAVNPMYNENNPNILLPLNAPGPIIQFAKYYGFNCVPKYPVLEPGMALPGMDPKQTVKSPPKASPKAPQPVPRTPPRVEAAPVKQAAPSPQQRSIAQPHVSSRGTVAAPLVPVASTAECSAPIEQPPERFQRRATLPAPSSRSNAQETAAPVVATIQRNGAGGAGNATQRRTSCPDTTPQTNAARVPQGNGRTTTSSQRVKTPTTLPFIPSSPRTAQLSGPIQCGERPKPARRGSALTSRPVSSDRINFFRASPQRRPTPVSPRPHGTQKDAESGNKQRATGAAAAGTAAPRPTRVTSSAGSNTATPANRSGNELRTETHVDRFAPLTSRSLFDSETEVVERQTYTHPEPVPAVRNVSTGAVSAGRRRRLSLSHRSSRSASSSGRSTHSANQHQRRLSQSHHFSASHSWPPPPQPIVPADPGYKLYARVLGYSVDDPTPERSRGLAHNGKDQSDNCLATVSETVSTGSARDENNPPPRWLAWGETSRGELGIDVAPICFVPIPVPSRSEPFVDMVCGDQFSVCITAKRGVYTMGDDSQGQLGVDDAVAKAKGYDALYSSSMQRPQFYEQDDIISVQCGAAFSVAITSEGVVYQWGANDRSQCAIFPTANSGEEARTPNSTCVRHPKRMTLRGRRVVRVACGDDFTLALTDDRSVVGWGAAQLLGVDAGHADAAPSNKNGATSQPCSLSFFTAEHSIVTLRAGAAHAVAIGAGGDVFTWGNGAHGRLGHGSEKTLVTPRQIQLVGGLTIADASCGTSHTAFLTTTGSVLLCGNNKDSQCGLPTFSHSCVLVPTPVSLPRKAIAVACGKVTTAFLLANGDVMVCGALRASGAGLGIGSVLLSPTHVMKYFLVLRVASRNTHSFGLGVRRNLVLHSIGQLNEGPPSEFEDRCISMRYNVVSFSVGLHLSLFATDHGSVHVMGNNNHGQLGLGRCAKVPIVDVDGESMPVALSITRVSTFPAGIRIASVSAGFAYAFAISEDQRVFSWGCNCTGQLALGVTRNSNKSPFASVDTPTEVTSLRDKQIVQIECGSFFALALSETGSVYSWGLLSCCGQPFSHTDPQSSSIPFKLPAHISIIHQNTPAYVCNTPIVISALQNCVASIACGEWHAVALKRDGSVFTWGIGSMGRLGHGDEQNVCQPTQVRFIGNMPICRVFCGAFNSFAISATNGKLYAWGNNELCQCGVDTEGANIKVPTEVASNIVKVSGGEKYAIAIRDDGRLLFSGVMKTQRELFSSPKFTDDPHLLPKPMRPQARSGYVTVDICSSKSHSLFLVDRRPEPESNVISAATAVSWHLTRELQNKLSHAEGSDDSS